MPVGRKRTPTEIIAARGGLDQPCRAAKREGEPMKLGELGDAPEYFDAGQVECWDELAHAVYVGTTGEADRFALEMAAILLARMRYDLTHMSAADMTRLHALLASFGMTPADRSKVSAPKKDAPEEGFGGIVGRERPRLVK